MCSWKWKAAFKNRGVDITASEELGLIIEYTTNVSKKRFQRLCNAYSQNPAEGLEVARKKLSERFGSDAVVTQVHLDKLTTSPKLAAKDNKGLQELGDLLLELQCVKQDGGLAGL